MKHYEDLIDRLRTATKLPLLQALMNEAADAIEELSKIAEQYLAEKKRIVSNADRIRAMTDEEMAKYMGDVQTWGGCPNHGARDCTDGV